MAPGPEFVPSERGLAVKIALDAMGGDFAPQATVEGAVQAARDFNLEVALVGDQRVLEEELARHSHKGLRLSIEHAAEVVAMHDSPVESVLSKPNSSLHVGYDLIRRGDAAAFVSAGNSGAVLTAGIVILGNLPGVDRPAIAAQVPGSGAENLALLIDAGANTEVKPFNLVQFALMGSVYWRHMRGIKHPRVGILSNGEEDSKGIDLTRIAAATLQAMGSAVNYIGYIEGRDINCGRVDVAVTDGFTGNIALKTMEGFARFMLGNLRDIFSAGWRGRFAYMLVRKRFAGMRMALDPAEYGGAPLLGINGIAIISHGSSNPHAIRNAIRLAAGEACNTQLNAEIVEILAKIPVEISGKSHSKGFRALFSKMRDRLHLHRESESTRKPETENVRGDKVGLRLESAEDNFTASPNGVAAAPEGRESASGFKDQSDEVRKDSQASENRHPDKSESD